MRATKREPTRPGASRSPTQPRRRRTTEEIDRLILDCARRLFSEKGYSETSTREIADTAGVAEVLIFRHFGSKADLFSSAVILPIAQFCDRWLDESANAEVGEERSTRFTAEFYKIIAENRGLIMSYLAMSVFQPDTIRGLDHTPELYRALDRIEENSREEIARLGVTSGVNLHITARASLAMWFAMALLHNLDDPREDPPYSEEEVISEMTRMVLYGCLNRPTAKQASAKVGSAGTKRVSQKGSPSKARRKAG